jgi:hypothetical protein
MLPVGLPVLALPLVLLAPVLLLPWLPAFLVASLPVPAAPAMLPAAATA